jgi:hypothetical protein
LNVVHESMCYFNISSIDPGVFAHCTLRLGLVYESLANIGSRKSALSSMPSKNQFKFSFVFVYLFILRFTIE